MARGQASKKRGSGAGLLDLRLRPTDRVGGASRSRGESGRHRHDSDTPAKKPGKKRGGGKHRSRIGRAIYWLAVLALWAIIAAIGLLVWVGIHLPPIRSVGRSRRSSRPAPESRFLRA